MSSWSFAEIELAIVCINAAGTSALAIAMLYLRSVFVSHKTHDHLSARVDRQSERLNEGDSRFGRVEDQIKALPTQESISALNIGIAGLKGDLKVLSAELAGYSALHRTLERQVGVIDEFLRARQA